MRLAFERVENLKNIGPTVAKNLRMVGIHTYGDLEKATPAKVFRQLQAHHPERTWPVCYYLYSLEGALRDKHWDDLPQAVKDRLLREAST
ncbi:MAG: TfoX/Sxy family DNA transformation protein [Pseudomonadota bacterium]